jgi:hypothetical protein
MASALILLHVATPVQAAISNGQYPTNAVAAEEQRILQYHQAEQAFQEQLKVGKQRYEQKQLSRAKTIAAMSAELQSRQKTVVFEPLERHDYANETSVLPWLCPIGAALAVGFFGFAFRLHQQNEKARRKSVSNGKEGVTFSAEDLLFFCHAPGVNGIGRSTKEGFLVLRGSIGPKAGADFRAPLLKPGTIREQGNTIIFVKDQLFPTASMAADALLGRSVNGWIEWKTREGMTLDTVLRLETQSPHVRVREEKPSLSTYKPASSAAG